MTDFMYLRKWLCLFLLAVMLQGCSGCTEEIIGAGASFRGLGFASDTTAILFYEFWEKTESLSITGPGHGMSHYDWELRLVDVRFHKVYWASRIKYRMSNSQGVRGRQWNDSTMLIELDGAGYWLWTVGNVKPQKVNFNWNSEMKKYETDGLLSHIDGFLLRPWKRDSILLFHLSRQSYGIIDTKTLTVNSWSPAGEDSWVTSCDDFWWGKNGGACLMNSDPYGFALLSEKGDTLGNFAYAHECVTYYDRKCNISSSFYYRFIMASLGACLMSECDAYPAKRSSDDTYYALIRYDDKLNVNIEPSLWVYSGPRLDGVIKFADSLGNFFGY